MWNAKLDESQTEIKITGRNINLRYAYDTILMAESEEELKSFLLKVKDESEKSGLKLSFQKKIMAFSPITSWQIDGEIVTLFSWAPKSLQMATEAKKLKDTCFLEEKLWPT